MYGQFVIDGSEDAGYGAWGVPLFCTVYLKSHWNNSDLDVR